MRVCLGGGVALGDVVPQDTARESEVGSGSEG